MPIAISPEPLPDERAAIELALAALASDHPPGRSEWWREGLREALGVDAADPSEAA